MTQRYILTGAPGAGKTAILRTLETLGEAVVEEAATDHIDRQLARGVAEPHMEADFLEAILALQRSRQRAADGLVAERLFFDRSPICTYALAIYLDRPIPPALTEEIRRLVAHRSYEKKVLFIESLGFMVNTGARRISLDDAVRFGRVHEESYHAFGYELEPIAPASVDERARRVLEVCAA